MPPSTHPNVTFPSPFFFFPPFFRVPARQERVPLQPFRSKPCCRCGFKPADRAVSFPFSLWRSIIFFDGLLVVFSVPFPLGLPAIGFSCFRASADSLAILFLFFSRSFRAPQPLALILPPPPWRSTICSGNCRQSDLFPERLP